MAQKRRWKLSAEQRSDLWKRWKAGESLHAIGRALGKEHHVILTGRLFGTMLHRIWALPVATG
jgi:hypothetical protein